MGLNDRIMTLHVVTKGWNWLLMAKILSYYTEICFTCTKMHKCDGTDDTWSLFLPCMFGDIIKAVPWHSQGGTSSL